MGDEVIESPPMVHTYALIRFSDMSEDLLNESSDASTAAVEKFASNYELASKMIKEILDKKFGPSFQVVVGEAFGFEVTYETSSFLHMYVQGNIAILIWKCS